MVMGDKASGGIKPADLRISLDLVVKSAFSLVNFQSLCRFCPSVSILVGTSPFHFWIPWVISPDLPENRWKIHHSSISSCVHDFHIKKTCFSSRVWLRYCHCSIRWTPIVWWSKPNLWCFQSSHVPSKSPLLQGKSPLFTDVCCLLLKSCFLMVKSCEMMFRGLVHQDAAGLVVGGAGSAISGMWNGKKGASARGLGSQAMGFNIRDLDDLVSPF